MSGQQSTSAGLETSADPVVPPSQVVRLEDLQSTLQAMVDKAISDRATSQPPSADDSGKWG